MFTTRAIIIAGGSPPPTLCFISSSSSSASISGCGVYSTNNGIIISSTCHSAPKEKTFQGEINELKSVKTEIKKEKRGVRGSSKESAQSRELN